MSGFSWNAANWSSILSWVEELWGEGKLEKGRRRKEEEGGGGRGGRGKEGEGERKKEGEEGGRRKEGKKRTSSGESH